MTELSDALRAQRIELAGDVHDRVIPPLFAARMRLETLAARLEPAAGNEATVATDAVIAELHRAVELIQSAISKSRQILQGLAPHQPGQQHWNSQLHQALGQQERDLQQSGSIPWERIDADRAVLLTSIAEEAIRNAVRHGDARRIEVTIAPVDREQEALASGGSQLYELTIQDDGRGFAPGERSDHHGLHLMRLRAAALGGQLSLSSRPGGPTRVLLRWPVPIGQ